MTLYDLIERIEQMNIFTFMFWCIIFEGIYFLMKTIIRAIVKITIGEQLIKIYAKLNKPRLIK